MKSNSLAALFIEAPQENPELSKVVSAIHDDAELQAEAYVKSAKVDLGGE